MGFDISAAEFPQQTKTRVFGVNRPLLITIRRCFVSKFRNTNRRLTGWNLCLQEYKLEICHIRSKDNVVADDLGRVSDPS